MHAGGEKIEERRVNTVVIAAIISHRMLTYKSETISFNVSISLRTVSFINTSHQMRNARGCRKNRRMPGEHGRDSRDIPKETIEERMHDKTQ